MKKTKIQDTPLIRIACEGTQADNQPVRPGATNGLINYCEGGNYVYLKFPLGIMGLNFKKFSRILEEFGWTLGMSNEPGGLKTSSNTIEFDLNVLTPLCSTCSVILIDGLLVAAENNEDARASLLKLRHSISNIQLKREQASREFINSAT